MKTLSDKITEKSELQSVLKEKETLIGKIRKNMEMMKELIHKIEK